MSLTHRQLAADREAWDNFVSPPTNWENSEATHWVFYWGGNASDDVIRYGYTEAGDVVPLNYCANLYSDLPYRDGAEVIAGLSHKTLLVVLDERVGRNGAWHFVSVVDTNPEVDGLVGYIYSGLGEIPAALQDTETMRIGALALDTTPQSNEMVFGTCIETIAAKVDEFCALTTPQWYTTTEPYFDSDSCEYLVSVTTQYYNTGDSALQSRMEEQIPIGVKALLEHYAKASDNETVGRLLNGFKFAKATSWWLDPSSARSPLKVLVSVHAKYFNAIPEKEIIIPDSSQNIFLLAKTFEVQINALSDMFKHYDGYRSWRGQNGSWNGPAPEYGFFNFKQEASNLQLFLSNFRRLLTLNGLALNERSNDTYEVALDDQYNIKYILVNSGDVGVVFLTVGFSTLLRTHPFNYPRTLAYVARMNELYNLVKKTKEMPKGWKQLIEEYTFPKPSFTKKQKKCDPNSLDSWDCIKSSFSNTFGDNAWGDFKKWKDWHKMDLKCDWISPESRQYLTPLGSNPTIADAYKSGGMDDYELPWAPFVTEEERDKLITRIDKDEWLKAWDRHGGPSSEFVGDPWQGEINQIVKEILTGATTKTTSQTKKLLEGEDPLELGALDSAMGQHMLNRLYYEALAKIDFKEKIRMLIDCACNELEEKAIWLENNGVGGDTASLIQADILRAQAAFIGCSDICKTIPLLCACLPFEWPPRFTIPDRLPTVDILAYIMTIILNAVINLIIQFIVQIISLMLDFSWKCETKGPQQQAFALNFDRSYGDIDLPALNQGLKQNSLPSDIIDPDILNQLLKDTSTILKPKEFCSLLTGNADLPTVNIVEKLIAESYPSVRAQWSTTQRVINLYTMLGEMIDLEICNNLADLMAAADTEGTNSLCENSEFRENLANGRATAEQIRELLTEAAKCDTARAEGIIELAKKSAGGEDFAAGLMPSIFQDPANPNGLVPREPPSVKFLNDIVKDTVFTPIEDQYNSDYNYHVDTIAPFQQVTAQPIPDAAEPHPVMELLADGLGAEPKAIQVVVAPTVMDNSYDEYENWLDPNNRDTVIMNVQNPAQSSTWLVLPPRRVWDDNFYTSRAVGRHGGSKDFNIWEQKNGPGTIPTSTPDRIERKLIKYELCPKVDPGTQWDRILDAYRVEGWRVPGELYFAFNGEKLLTPAVLSVVTDEQLGHPIRGVAAPPVEAFNNYLLGKWMELPVSSAVNARTYLENSEAFLEYHMEHLYPELIKYVLGQVFDIMKAGRFLKLAPDDGKEEIIEADFSSDSFCNPRPEGLLNVNDLRRRTTSHAARSLLLDPQRNTAAITYGIGVAYMKIFLIEMLLDSIFVFSEFKFSSVAKSDLLFRYFINRFNKKSGLTESNVLTFEGGFVENIPFFEDLVFRIDQDLLSRKYDDREEFKDPLTGEPIELLLASEKLFELNLPNTEEAQKNLTGGKTLEGREPADVSVEKVPVCQIEGSECFEVGNMTFSNMWSTESIDPDTGKKTMGFMEYSVRDLVASMAGEYDTVLQGHITPVSWLNEIAEVVDVPKTSPIGKPRFFIGFGTEDSNEPFSVNEESIRDELGNSELAEVYWAWGVLREQGENIHNFVQNNVEEEGQRFRAALDEIGFDVSEQIFDAEPIVLDCATWNRFGGTDHRIVSLETDGERYDYATRWRWTWNQNKFSDPGMIEVNAGEVVWTQWFDYKLEDGDNHCGENFGGDGRDNGSSKVITWKIKQNVYPPASKLENYIMRSLSDSTDEILNAQRGSDDEPIGDIYCDTQPGSLKYDFCKAGLGTHGGFVLERFVKITDKSFEEDWPIILGTLRAEYGDATANRAESLIKNRDSSLFGVVNLQAWSDWVRTLLDYHEELGLFVKPADGKPYLNITKYFDKWEMGTRLTFVYPLEHGGPGRINLNSDLAETFAEPMQPQVERFIQTNKSHLLQEDLTFRNQVELEDPNDPNARTLLDLETSEEIVDIKTLPLMEGLVELQSADIKFPALHNDTRSAIQACIQSIQDVFLDPIENGLSGDPGFKDDAIKFNNFVLPYDSACRQGDQSEFYYSAYAYSWSNANSPLRKTGWLQNWGGRVVPPWMEPWSEAVSRLRLGPDGNFYSGNRSLPGGESAVQPDFERVRGDGSNSQYWQMVKKIWDLGYRLFGFNVWGAFGGEFQFNADDAPPEWTLAVRQNGEDPVRDSDLIYNKPSEYYTDKDREGRQRTFPAHPGSETRQHEQRQEMDAYGRYHQVTGPGLEGGEATVPRANNWTTTQPGGHVRCLSNGAGSVQSGAPGTLRTTGVYALAGCNKSPAVKDNDLQPKIFLSDFSTDHPEARCRGGLYGSPEGEAWTLDMLGVDLGAHNIDIDARLYGPMISETVEEYTDRRERIAGPLWYESFVDDLLKPHKYDTDDLGLISARNFRWGRKWVHGWLTYSIKKPFEDMLQQDLPEQLSEIPGDHLLKVMMENFKDFLEKQLEAMEPDGLTPTRRCLRDPGDPNSRLGTANCEAYDKIINAIQQLEYYIGRMENQLVIPQAAIRFEKIHADNSLILKKQIIQNPQYEAVLEYMIPSTRLISLATIYNAEHISGLPNREMMFKTTKDLIKELYNVARGSEHPSWWAMKAKPRNRWWQKPLELPIPLILLIFPWMILKALFSIVPWLRKLLDIKIPSLPPHKKKRGRRCP